MARRERTLHLCATAGTVPALSQSGSHVRRTLPRALAAFAVAAWLPVAALAQDMEQDQKLKEQMSKVPDIEAGLNVARKLCTSCHLIGEPPPEGAANTVPADVPTFPSIANRPDQSMVNLTNWLIEPHPPMPNPNLSRLEIRDLAGYILSLRDRE